ncbi:MAG: coaD, partial [Chloroflexi bacterium]|nr:coaD [Chloroflexota bacterium]
MATPPGGPASTERRDRGNEPLVALYPGSFDPIHNGHLDVITRASALFRQVIVGVYDKPDKRLTFSTTERVHLVQTAVADITNVEVASYSILTVDYARERNAQAIIRGLRATSDFDFEFQVALMNRHLNSQIEAPFLMTSLE